MPKRYKDLYSILKHPKIKLKIGEKVVQTIRIKKIFIVGMAHYSDQTVVSTTRRMGKQVSYINKVREVPVRMRFMSVMYILVLCLKGAEAIEVFEDARRCFDSRCCLRGIEFYPTWERINFYQYEDIARGIWTDITLGIWLTSNGLVLICRWVGLITWQHGHCRMKWNYVPLQSCRTLSLGLIALVAKPTGELSAMACLPSHIGAIVHLALLGTL